MKVAIALAALTLAGSASAMPSRDFDPTTDLIVAGKVATIKYRSLGDDLVTDGEITARLTITRVIRGRPPQPVLTIIYIAHADRPADQVGRYHLRRSKDGKWLACRQGGGRGFICR